MVHRDTIDRVRRQVAECPDEALDREFEGFFRDQGEICDFVMDLTATSRQPVRELALYLSYVVYRVVAEDSGPLRPVRPETIAAACLESRRWIERMSEPVVAEAAAVPEAAGAEPYLIGYVVTEVQDAIEDGLDLGDEETGTVLFVLKTVISSLTDGSD